MADGDHVKTLRAAREHLVARRRLIASNLAEARVAGQVEQQIADFTETQAAIEAIDEAIGDEKEREDEELQARSEANRPLPEWKPSDPFGDEPAGG